MQETLVAQLAEAVFDNFPPGFYFVVVVTALILVLAANTAYNGFPVLGSILSQDRYLPRQLHTRGDRLAFSNGILVLAGIAIVLVIGFQAEVTRLIALYTVGVFTSFTLSQIGMLRHWKRLLATETDPAERQRMRRSQAINGFGAAMTGIVLVIVLITKFTRGAWIAIAAMAVFYALMLAIQKHYDRVAAELVAGEYDGVLPSRNHGIVLVSTLHKPTLRAVAYARATRPDVLEAVTVNVDDADTKKLMRDWDKRKIPVPLKVIESPYREITRPVLDYVKRIRTDNPRDVVTVFIPEYVVGHWWEQILHNQSALRLKGRLLFTPGVMVTNVPWQLASSARVAQRRPETPPGPGPARLRAGARRRAGAAAAAAARRPRPGRAGREPDPPVTTAARSTGPTGSWSSRSGRWRTAGTAWPARDGRVVFVRHALPGERVRAVVSEDGGGSFCRADAVAVLAAGPAAGAGAVRLGPGRRLRRLRPAARRPGRAARAEGGRAGRAAAPAGRDRAGGAGRGAARRPAGLAAAGSGWPWTPTAGPGCARTAATTCCRSRDCPLAPPGALAAGARARLRPGRGGRARGGDRRRRRGSTSGRRRPGRAARRRARVAALARGVLAGAPGAAGRAGGGGGGVGRRAGRRPGLGPLRRRRAVRRGAGRAGRRRPAR